MRIRTELKTALFLTELARCGSIGKTAALHNVAPSTALRHLRAFEKACGKTLLAATPQGTGLTETGLLLAARLEKDIRAALAPVGRLPYETLTVSLDGRLSCPTVTVTILRWSAGLANTVRFVAPGVNADLIISLAPKGGSSFGFTRGFAASPGYLNDAGIPYTLTNLAAHTLILCEKDAGRFEASHLRKILVPTLADGLNAAENGLGLLFGVTEKLITPQRQSSTLSIVPLKEENGEAIRIRSNSVACTELLLALQQLWGSES